MALLSGRRARRNQYLGGCVAIACLSVWGAHGAESKTEPTEPKLLSVFPSAGQRGTKVQVEVRGHLLDGVHTIAGLPARLVRVEKSGDSVPTVYLAILEIDLQSGVQSGVHELRLEGSRGVSDALRFRVVDEPLTVEKADAHPQAINIGAFVTGKLEKSGETDCYSFHAKEGQELSFEVVQAENFDPRLALFRPGASWLTPGRPLRVLFEEERSSDLMPIRPRRFYRVSQSGEYLLEISSLFGKGSADSTYQLQIASGQMDDGMRDDASETTWRERSFRRKLGADWAEMVRSRAVNESALAESITRSTEQEPNDSATQANKISLPALIEGTIERPGDVDSFRFRVEAGQKLAFEIETPHTPPPHFNPRICVIDSEGREVLSNVHKRISLFNNNAEQEIYLKAVEPKAIHTFETTGEYFLQIRDITSRYGNSAYAYRVLVRAQIPHAGEVSSPDIDRINLVRGKAKKLTLTALHEEGFSGDVVFWFTDLLPGVTAYPTGQLIEEHAPKDAPEDADAVLPKPFGTTIVLAAGPDAELSPRSSTVRLYCRPIVNGVPGANLLVREVPFMVVEEVRK